MTMQAAIINEIDSFNISNDDLFVRELMEHMSLEISAMCDRTGQRTNMSGCLKNASIGIPVLSIPNETEAYFDWSSMGEREDPYAIPMTVVYLLLLITGVIGNVCTCIVIARNRYMHTATNYYLFSLAVSDLLLLILGLPQDLHHLWSKYPYIFGEAFCVLRGWASETSTNASILTITAFTVERYLAICHPIRAHTMSRLSRAIKFIIIIWIISALSAITMAYQLGIIYEQDSVGNDVLGTSMCAMKRHLDHSFEWFTAIFFFLPATILCILYALIGLQLRRSTDMGRRTEGKPSVPNVNGTSKVQGKALNVPGRSVHRKSSSTTSRKDVVKMLVAVVIAFFFCWVPFHAQRLMAVYITEPTEEDFLAFSYLTNISGVLYYVSATINPILYSIMSLKFRHAFRDTLGRCLRKGKASRHGERFRSQSVYNSTMRSGAYELTDLTVVSEAPHHDLGHPLHNGGHGSPMKKFSRVDQISMKRYDDHRLQDSVNDSDSALRKKMSSISNTSMKMTEAFDDSSISDYID